jgi:hypothetical protein
VGHAEHARGDIERGPCGFGNERRPVGSDPGGVGLAVLGEHGGGGLVGVTEQITGAGLVLLAARGTDG